MKSTCSSLDTLSGPCWPISHWLSELCPHYDQLSSSSQVQTEFIFPFLREVWHFLSLHLCKNGPVLISLHFWLFVLFEISLESLSFILYGCKWISPRGKTPCILTIVWIAQTWFSFYFSSIPLQTANAMLTSFATPYLQFRHLYLWVFLLSEMENKQFETRALFSSCLGIGPSCVVSLCLFKISVKLHPN